MVSQNENGSSGNRVWIGFIQLRMKASGGLLRTQLINLKVP
jgi:hypothetical protein